MFYTDSYTDRNLLSLISQIDTLNSSRLYKYFILYKVNVVRKKFILFIVIKFEFLSVLCVVSGFNSLESRAQGLFWFVWGNTLPVLWLGCNSLKRCGSKALTLVDGLIRRFKTELNVAGFQNGLDN